MLEKKTYRKKGRYVSQRTEEVEPMLFRESEMGDSQESSSQIEQPDQPGETLEDTNESVQVIPPSTIPSESDLHQLEPSIYELQDKNTEPTSELHTFQDIPCQQEKIDQFEEDCPNEQITSEQQVWEHSDLEHTLSILRDQLSAANESNASLKAKQEALLQEIEELKDEASRHDVSELENKIKILTDQLKTANGSRATLESQCSELKEEVDKLKEAASTTPDPSKIQEELAKLKSENGVLITQRDRQQEELQNLQAKLIKDKNEMESDKSVLLFLQNQTRSLQSKITHLEDDYLKEMIESEKRSSEYSAMEASMTALKNHLTAANESNASLKAKQEALQKEILELKEEASKHDVSELEGKIKILSDQLTAAHKTRADLESQHDALKVEMQKLKDEARSAPDLSKIQEELAKLKSENAALITERDRQQEEIESHEQDMTDTTEQLETLDKENKDLKEKYDEAREKRNDAESRLSRIQEHASSLSTENEEQRITISQLESENDRLVAEVKLMKDNHEKLIIEKGELDRRFRNTLMELDDRKKTNIDEVAYMAKQTSERMSTVASQIEKTMYNLGSTMDKNRKKLLASGVITKPSPKDSNPIIYWLWKYPVYQLEMAWYGSWLKTFLILVFPSLLLLLTFIALNQNREITHLKATEQNLRETEEKYRMVKRLARPGSSLEDFCERLDVYYSDKEYYNDRIDSLKVILSIDKK